MLGAAIVVIETFRSRDMDLCGTKLRAQKGRLDISRVGGAAQFGKLKYRWQNTSTLWIVKEDAEC
jgi:hypothetical protein